MKASAPALKISWYTTVNGNANSRTEAPTTPRIDRIRLSLEPHDPPGPGGVASTRGLTSGLIQAATPSSQPTWSSTAVHSPIGCTVLPQPSADSKPVAHR